MVERLLEAGASVNYQNKVGNYKQAYAQTHTLPQIQFTTSFKNLSDLSQWTYLFSNTSLQWLTTT